MLGTLTLAAGSAVAGWLLQHAYQSLRYSFYERGRGHARGRRR